MADRPRQRPPLLLGGVAIARYGWDEAMAAVLASAQAGPVRVAWVYANCINLARDDAAYRAALAKFDLVLNDGAGIELAGRWLHRPVLANLCGTDWIPAFFDRLAATEGGPRRIFVLGTRDDVLERLRSQFPQRWPGLKLVGTHHGFFTDPDPILEAIAAARTEVLLVAMGVPLQESFLNAQWSRLTAAGVRIALAGGAVVDYLTDAVPRAPRWVRRVRMEWVYRLAVEPRRLWRRYVWGTVRFLAFVARERLRAQHPGGLET